MFRNCPFSLIKKVPLKFRAPTPRLKCFLRPCVSSLLSNVCYCNFSRVILCFSVHSKNSPCKINGICRRLCANFANLWGSKISSEARAFESRSRPPGNYPGYPPLDSLSEAPESRKGIWAESRAPMVFEFWARLFKSFVCQRIVFGFWCRFPPARGVDILNIHISSLYT